MFLNILFYSLYLTETQRNDYDIKKQLQNQANRYRRAIPYASTKHIAREHVVTDMPPRNMFRGCVTLPTFSVAIRNLRGSAGWVGLEWCKPHRSDYALPIHPRRKPSFCLTGRRHTSSNSSYPKTG